MPLDLIIPATDRPGAKAARVSYFIDLILSDWSKQEEKTRFMAGIQEVDHRSQLLYGKRFVNATPAQQSEIVSGLDDALMGSFQELQANRRGNRRPPEKTFFYMMKQLTLVKYEIIPTAHEQCAPITIKEKS